MNKKKILICGAGSIGKRHLNNLLMQDVEVTVWRKRLGKKQELLDEFEDSISVVDDINKAISNSDAVVVATETGSHRSIIETSIGMNKHLYIEKPIARKPDGLTELAQQIDNRKLAVEIGCQLRKHPSLIRLKQLLTDSSNPIYSFRIYAGQRLEHWRPGTDYTASYSADRDRGGGVLLDLIHEIDLALWLMGNVKEVYGDLTQISDQKIQADDLANIIITLDSGAVGQIQLDLVSPVLRRGIEIITKNKIYFWDYTSGNLEMFTKEKKEVIESVSGSYKRNDMFLALMNHFLKRIDEVSIPEICSFEDGIKSLKVVAAIESSNVHRAPMAIEL